jgi:hypothetical protein
MGELDPRDDDIWMPMMIPMMEAAEKGLIVCRLPCWQASKGVHFEIEHFRKLGRPIIYMMPDEVPADLCPAS